MPVTAIAAVPVSAIVAAAGTLLLDPTHIRWNVAELIRWTNEAMSAIMALRPSAFSRIDTHTLAAGTYQSLPNGSAILIDVTRNIGSSGAPGRAIRITDRKSLDDANPDWHTLPQVGEIRHFMHDPAIPKVYYVYPPAIAGTVVEVARAVLPPDVTAESDAIPIGAEYKAAIVNYVCGRCHLKDSEFANAGQAATFYQAFQMSLGMGAQ